MPQYGIPKKNNIEKKFMSERFNCFCQQIHIEHVTCPISDQSRTGQIESLIKNSGQAQLGAKFFKNDSSGLFDFLSTFRTGRKADGKSPIEKQYGREPKTIKSNLVNELLGTSEGVSEQDSRATFTLLDFEEIIDSTNLVRERSRSSKLEPTFLMEKKEKGMRQSTL